MLTVAFLLRHANSIACVQAAAKGAALKEAAVQIARLDSLDLSHAEAHHRVIVRRWRHELNRLLEQRRQA